MGFCKCCNLVLENEAMGDITEDVRDISDCLGINLVMESDSSVVTRAGSVHLMSTQISLCVSLSASALIPGPVSSRVSSAPTHVTTLRTRAVTLGCSVSGSGSCLVSEQRGLGSGPIH